MAFDDVWEKRHVYVIEGMSKLPQYAYSKRVLFIDKETLVVPLLRHLRPRRRALEGLDQRLSSFRKEPFPGAKASCTTTRWRFAPAIVMVDVKPTTPPASPCPSRSSADAEGWFFNMGERLGLTENWFKISSLIQAAQ